MIDPEKIPDAPCGDISYAGVALISRYGKRREFEAMMSAIDWIIDRYPDVAELLVEIYCDSKAQFCFTAGCCHACTSCSPAEARAVADALDHAFREVNGGHNGIIVEAHEGGRIEVDPSWNDDLF